MRMHKTFHVVFKHAFARDALSAENAMNNVRNDIHFLSG
jgi:hypothetical protein